MSAQNERFRSALVPIIAGTLLAITAPSALAQSASGAPVDATAEGESPYEGRPIRQLLLREPVPNPEEGGETFRELSDADQQQARNNIRARTATPFSAQTVRDDVARLNRLGAYRRIEGLVQPLDDGGVRLIYTLESQPLIRDVQTTGNRQIADNEIGQQLDVLVGTPVDRFQIDRAARRIEDLYREEGYYNAEVTVDQQALDEQSIVLFRIREGQRIKVNKIRFEAFDGELAFQDRQLRREIETRESNIIRRGVLDDDVLASDEAALVSFYRDRGYLDARADTLIQPDASGREAILTYIIEQGRLYTLRNIIVEFDDPENSPFTAEQIRGHMVLKPGQTFGVRDLRTSLDAVRDAYGQLGHTEVYENNRVTSAQLRDPDRPLVDLVVRILAGPAYKTGEILIQGNDLTKDDVIRRHIDVRPGRVLDVPAVRQSEEDLERLNLFNRLPPDFGVKITYQPPDPVEPDYRDVLIEIEETNTGSFDIGGAVSSDAGLIGRIAITQRNFDVADTPDSAGEFFTGRAFRGAGQRFTIEALPGDEIQTYSISLAEPFLFETNYSGSVQAFFRDREFREFDEIRYGGRYSVGRTFGRRWAGAITGRTEVVDISNIENDNPTDFFLFEDDTLLAGVGLSLTRTTVDNRLFPTRGARTEFGSEFVGGDTTFTRFSLEHTVFIPIYEDFRERKTVLSFSTRMGYIPTDEEDVPIFERFYQGGQTFRGFAFRTIAERGVSQNNGAFSDEPIGGTWLFFAGAEIRQPVVEDTIYVVGFVDSGTVEFEPGFEDYRLAVGVGLRFRVPQLSPAPLAFDFGFPIIKQFGDEERVFSFSIDLPF